MINGQIIPTRRKTAIKKHGTVTKIFTINLRNLNEVIAFLEDTHKVEKQEFWKEMMKL